MKPSRSPSAAGATGATRRPPRVIPERKPYEPPSPEQLLHRSRHAPDSDMTDAKGKPIPVVEAPDPHEFVPDARAGYGRPYRTVDTLTVMEKRKTIEPHHAAAGRRFQEDFERAALNQLRAGDLSRGSYRRGGYVGLELTEAMVQARQDVDAVMRALGGRESPAGSVVWGVLGEQQNVKEFCERSVGGAARSFNVEVVRGILIATLCVISAFYGYDNDTPARPRHRRGAA